MFISAFRDSFEEFKIQDFSEGHLSAHDNNNKRTRKATEMW